MRFTMSNKLSGESEPRPGVCVCVCVCETVVC